MVREKVLGGQEMGEKIYYKSTDRKEGPADKQKGRGAAEARMQKRKAESKDKHQ